VKLCHINHSSPGFLIHSVFPVSVKPVYCFRVSSH